MKIDKQDSSSRARLLLRSHRRVTRPSVFSSPKTYSVGQTTMESVDTCRGIASGLKCPAVAIAKMRLVASSMHDHVSGMQANAGWHTSVPFLDPFSLISAWSVKNGATRMGRTSAYTISLWDLSRCDGLLSRCFRFNFSVEFADRNGVIATLLLHLAQFAQFASLNDNNRQLFAFSRNIAFNKFGYYCYEPTIIYNFIFFFIAIFN